MALFFLMKTFYLFLDIACIISFRLVFILICYTLFASLV